MEVHGARGHREGSPRTSAGVRGPMRRPPSRQPAIRGKFILIIVWAIRLTSPVLFTGPARVPLRVRVHLQRGSMQRSAVGVRAHRFAHGHDAEVVGRKQDFLRGVCVGSQGRK